MLWVRHDGMCVRAESGGGASSLLQWRGATEGAGRPAARMPSKNYTLGRRIKQQSGSNELTGWAQAPPPPRLPAHLLKTHPYLLHPGTPPTSPFLLPSSRAAVKVGRKVRCLRELREHSCLSQTEQPPWNIHTHTLALLPHPPRLITSHPQPTPGLTKGTFIQRAWKLVWGLLSLHSLTHTEEKKDCVESLFMANSQCVCFYVGIQAQIYHTEWKSSWEDSCWELVATHRFYAKACLETQTTSGSTDLS